MRALTIALACMMLAACAGGFSAGYFTKGELKYRVAAPDSDEWKPVSFAENDLAWLNRKTGQLLAINSTCSNFGDPSLEVLSNHLMMGFTDKAMTERKTYLLDGRDALETSYTAKLDGVGVDITIAVVKKDGCVHDFTFVSPPGQGGQRAELDRALDGFTTTAGAPPPREATVRLGTPEFHPEGAHDESEAKAP